MMRGLRRRLAAAVGIGGPPRLSVIVNFYDMAREAPRTLFTLSPAYQLRIRAEDYEVVAIDNGSPEPLRPRDVSAFGPNFRLVVEPPGCPSPVRALNRAARTATAPWLVCIIDGARMVSPGLLGTAVAALATVREPFIYTMGLHLGLALQNKLVEQGWTAADEDRLLDSVDWSANGYKLFGISSPSGSSPHGFLGVMSESNAFMLRRETFLAMGGFDERFVSRGGGLANLDFFKRAIERVDVTPICLLGEASFHQMHGGVATNVPLGAHPWAEFAAEYEGIRGEPFHVPDQSRTVYFGALTTEARRWLAVEPAPVPSPPRQRLDSQLIR